MSKLGDWITVSDKEQPYVNFESSLDKDEVVSGYVPVKSTLDVLSFLTEATATHASQGRAVICYGSYGSGKSRLCSVLARLFRDGFDCAALQPVWRKLSDRGESLRVEALCQAMIPGGQSWRPWLVVTAYAASSGATFSTSLIRALFEAVKRAGLDDSVLGTTIYGAAAVRLGEMIQSGAEYKPVTGSPYATVDQLRRALTEDNDDNALDVFRAFYRSATFGTEFDDWVRHSGEISLEAYDAFNTVTEQIQRFGYEGIIVIWDEFGFFIEELLRGSEHGERSLGQEAMTIQNFIERSCSNTQLGEKVVFLGFTHVSLDEYGSRQGLGESDSDRLSTVSDRFRDPSIPIKLSLTENDGYHLLAGMIDRTEEGHRIFANTIPKLQKLASKMPDCDLWERLSPWNCYNEIVAPCYPLHAATSAALLLLSDQVAQVARTTFYYLQNAQHEGLAGQLRTREAPAEAQIGGAELIRPHELFAFFEDAIRESNSHHYDQYKEAVSRFPQATNFDIAVLKTTLILSVIASREMPPTTDFLSVCLCDASVKERAAGELHDSLRRLTDAEALWKNEATDVWGFVGTRGFTFKLENDLEEEKYHIRDMEAAWLLRDNPDIQAEVIDLIGDFDLDPATTGIVRRVGIRLLDISLARAQDLDTVNPVKGSPVVSWRSALVYLVATDTPEALARWRDEAQNMERPNTYFVIPPSPIALDSEQVRNLIAARNLLEKADPDTNRYEVLEGKLTHLRSTIAAKFRESFGNEGLRRGTVVIRAGQGDTAVRVSSWNELLPAIADDLESSFPQQIKVRCGTFNEWKTIQSLAPIENVVARILLFDQTPQWRTQYLGFKDTSQQAAIVDGVLVENDLLIEDPLSGKWTLQRAVSECPVEAIQETLRHFQSGGSKDKEVATLFSRLINPPYGIPNGVIPLLIAMVVREEESRVAVYFGAQNQRVDDAHLAKAITDMGRHPSQYRTRYNRLSTKQRIVFRAVGPEVGAQFTESFMRGEAFYKQCERVRVELRNWIKPFPEMVLSLPDLTDKQRQLTRLLRLPVPSQLPVLADSLFEVFKEDEDSAVELDTAESATRNFPFVTACWRQYKTTVERYVDGVKAPLRTAILRISGQESTANPETPKIIGKALRELDSEFSDNYPLFRSLDALDQTMEDSDPLDAVASAISGKASVKLTEEDFGKAIGVLEIASAIKDANNKRCERDEFEIVEPNGKRRRFGRFQHEEGLALVSRQLHQLASEFSISVEEAKSLLIQAICDADAPAAYPIPNPDSSEAG